jgi:hypothetical protein
MQSSSQSASSIQPARARQREDVTYQIMTVAAILTVLVTVWVF